MTSLLVGAAVVAAVLLARTPRARAAPPVSDAPAAPAPDVAGRGTRGWLWPVLAGFGGWGFVGGLPGLVTGLLAAGVVRAVVVRAEPPDVRRRREQVRGDLPTLVLLVSLALRAGAATPSAVRLAAQALPGPAAERVVPAADRLALGVDPQRVWAELADDPDLAPLGQALARAERSGAPVAGVVARLADDLARSGRAELEERARAVGVRAAVPLGLCLLPAFLLLGIVPLVASLVADLSW